MMRTSVSRLHGKLSLILICAALGACSSMQKSSSSSAGEQSAAPISEAPQPGDKAASGGTSPSSSSSTSKAGPNSDVNGKPLPADAAAKSEEARQLKRQLDEQDAQINRLRNEQQAEEARLDADAARSQEQQRSAAAAGSQGKSGVNDEAVVFPSGDNSATPAGTAAAAAAAAEAAANSGNGTGAAVAATSERSVYFGYNEALVSEKYDDMLVANANYLRAHPTFTAEVQGNCDDRGSREYNLALGARRAEAVKRALELAGANGSHITTVSYGAEKPVATGHDEESYSKNRRVDIIY